VRSTHGWWRVAPRGQLRKKRAHLEQALQGQLRPHQAFVLTERLAQIDSLEETIARFDAQIATACAAAAEEAEGVRLLETIPDSAVRTAELLVAASGTDGGRLLSVEALAAWVGLAPGNTASAGRQRRGRTRTGNTWMRAALVPAAKAAARMKHTALGARSQRIAARLAAEQRRRPSRWHRHGW
jgi:transposase